MVEVRKPPGKSQISLSDVADRMRGLSPEEVLHLLKSAGHSISPEQGLQKAKTPSSQPPKSKEKVAVLEESTLRPPPQPQDENVASGEEPANQQQLEATLLFWAITAVP
jgi:hypothetical protein